MGAAVEWVDGPRAGRADRQEPALADDGRQASIADAALVLQELHERRTAHPPRSCTSCAAQETPLHRAPCNACAAPDFAGWRPMGGPAGQRSAHAATPRRAGAA